MKLARSSLIALSMLHGGHAAMAKTPASTAMDPKPLNSPGIWVGDADYPRVALRFGMAGITAFRLTVSPTGVPVRCDIVVSSSFDVLDRATCQHLMANARFSAARDKAGNPVEGMYSNRIRWALPNGTQGPISERFASLMLLIDQTGKVTSCRLVLHVPAVTPASAENPCGREASLPLPLGLEFRGDFKGPSAEVEYQMAEVFTPALRAQVLAPRPGYEQRALNVFQFDVRSDGKVAQCSYQEQRGSDHMALDFCEGARGQTFDPPFAAIDKNGVAHGWHILRVMLKTGA